MGKYDTSLSPADERLFAVWKAQYAPHDSGADYDLRGAFKAGLTPDPQTGHWPDTFKKPNHPTFSDQSKYAVGKDAKKAGHWVGEQYMPPKNSTGFPPYQIEQQNPQFNQPVPQGNYLMQMMAMLAPYFQEQARAQQNFLPQLVQAKHGIAGGGKRNMAGDLMLDDPLAEKQRQDALWEATFSSPEERIAKERKRFQTPADIPTFTERERAGVNARARMRYGGGGRAQTAAPTSPTATPSPAEPLAQLGSPVPTPPTQRMGPPALTPSTAPAGTAPVPKMSVPSGPLIQAASYAGGFGAGVGTPETALMGPLLRTGLGVGTPEMATIGNLLGRPLIKAGMGIGTPEAALYGPALRTVGGVGTPEMIALRALPNLISSITPAIAPPQGYAPGAEFPRGNQGGAFQAPVEAPMPSFQLSDLIPSPAAPNPYAEAAPGPGGTPTYPAMESNANLPSFLEALAGLIPNPMPPNPYDVSRPPAPPRRYLGGY